MKFSLHTCFLITIFIDISVATERQCHNETGRCYWLGTEVKHGTLCEQPVNQMEEILLSWKQKSYGILR